MRLYHAQLFETVYQQQFVKLTPCIHLRLVCLRSVLMTILLYILQTFVMHFLSGAENKGHYNCHLLYFICT